MRRAALALAVAVGGCAAMKPGMTTPHAAVEYSMVGAEAAYQGAVAGIDAAETIRVLTPATHDDLWRRYWKDLQDFRRSYRAGQDLTLAWSVLVADQAQATRLAK